MCKFPIWQVWYKPLPQEAAAVLVVNNGNQVVDVSVELLTLNVSCTSCHVSNIWNHRIILAPVASRAKFMAKALTPHDSAFVVVSDGHSDAWREATKLRG
jgi:hypothetical protein